MPLQCKDLRPDLVAFADGELELDRAKEVQAHVVTCAACAAEVEAHHAVWDALGVLDVDAPIDPAWLDRVAAGIQQPARPAVAWRWVAAAAAFALAVGLGLGSAVFPDEGPVAVRPTGPAPSAGPVSPVPAPSATLQPSPPPSATPTPAQPETWPADTAVAQADPYKGLTPEEIAVIENLDVLVYLQAQDDLEVLENLDLLEDLDEEELEGAG